MDKVQVQVLVSCKHRLLLLPLAMSPACLSPCLPPSL